MDRLFLVDQTLNRLGGSDFEYLSCIADAAIREQRHSVAIGTGKRFPWKQRQHDEAARDLFRAAKILPIFRNTGERHHGWLADRSPRVSVARSGQNPLRGPSKLAGLLRAYGDRVVRLKRRKLIARFACDCNRFFRRALTGGVRGEFRIGDHVFFSNVSELELMGLAVFLAHAPSSVLATWHLQFRHELPAGELGFDARSSLVRKVRACFMASLSRVPDHDFRFYGLSAELVEQYERLELMPFSVLPYPVSPEFRPMRSAAAIRRGHFCEPVLTLHGSEGSAACTDRHSLELRERDRGFVRVAVPTEIDVEGEVLLRRMVEGLREDYFAEGQLQLTFSSSSKKNWWSPSAKVPAATSGKFGGLTATVGEAAIENLRPPVSRSQYGSLVRNCDFALLLPSRRHSDSDHARRFGELMSCGTPVIVPAGSLMAIKLQPSQNRHINSLRERLPLSRALRLEDLRFGSANAPLSGGVVSFDRGQHPFEAEIEKRSSENVAVVRFRWHHANRNHFARVCCNETRGDGERRLTERVVPQRRAGHYSLALFRLGFGGDQVRFKFENAFDDASVAIRDLSVELFSVADLNEVRLGANGLIYADAMSIEREIIEVVENIGHYQRSAEAASQAWWRSHDPQQTLEGIAGARFYETLRDAA